LYLFQSQHETLFEQPLIKYFEFIESDSPQLAQQYQQLTQLAQQSPEKFTQSIPQEVQEAILFSFLS
jgi:hypothetical protein